MNGYDLLILLTLWSVFGAACRKAGAHRERKRWISTGRYILPPRP